MTTEREAQLAKVPFFDGLTPEALAMIAQVTTEESHAPGTLIFGYGTPGDKLCIILEGKVRISREVGGMGEEALAVLGAGEVFGEMAFLLERPRTLDVDAASDSVRVLSLSESTVRKMVAEDSDVAAKLLFNVSKMLCVRIVKAS